MIPNHIDSIKGSFYYETENFQYFLYNSFLAIKTNAKFVLVVEKDATFQRLLNDNFIAKYNGILVTVRQNPKFA